MNISPEHLLPLPELWLPLPADPGTGPSTDILTAQDARLWALVLEARYVPVRIEQNGAGWRVLVPAPAFARALREVRLFEEENSNWPPPLPPVRPLEENTLSTLSVLLLLAMFHNLTRFGVTLPGHASTDWFDLGNANAASILDGQWWRAVTALTLHADASHLAGNLAIGGFIAVLLCRELGAGLSWALLLGSGILGNLTNAYLQLPAHRSVGASTAVFGAVGIFAALSAMRYIHHPNRRGLIPASAGLALLAALGTESEPTDLVAHLFAFLWGIGFGIAAEFRLATSGRPGRMVNAVLALASALVVASAWWMAFTAGG
ncbi:MAG TPA: rhomboid family intramembrane serine protease [Geobacter anodireducens]|nr:rhomboid family intramembrane serine protease [Geobacter anodireducens]